MSAHATTSSHSSGDSIFTSPKTWFASKSPRISTPLDAPVDVGHNTVDATIGTVTKYLKDIWNPAVNSLRNLGWLVWVPDYRANGWKTLPKAIAGTVTNASTAVANVVTGLFRGTDHIVTRGVTDSVVDIASGTTDRVPAIGKFVGNVAKLIAAIPGAVGRTLGNAATYSVDAILDGANSAVLKAPPARHLTTANATSSSAHH